MRSLSAVLGLLLSWKLLETDKLHLRYLRGPWGLQFEFITFWLGTLNDFSVIMNGFLVSGSASTDLLPPFFESEKVIPRKTGHSLGAL